MRKVYYAAAMLLAVIVVATSCSKYEDGPAFSLLTKKARLSGEWVIEQALINDADVTSAFVAAIGSDFVLEIEKDGKYRTEGANADTGTWELGEDKDDIFMKSDSAGATQQSFRILRLKNKELWLRQTQSNGDFYIYHYKAK